MAVGCHGRAKRVVLAKGSSCRNTSVLIFFSDVKRIVSRFHGLHEMRSACAKQKTKYTDVYKIKKYS